MSDIFVIKILEDYPVYGVDEKGNVYSFHKEGYRKLKPWLDKDGYRRIHISNKDGRKGFSVSRLMLMAFKPEDNNTLTVNHIDGDKTKDVITNLEWATRKQQIDHAFKLGLKKGYEQGKLEPFDIPHIRLLLAQGRMQKNIAHSYSVHPSTIGKIKTGVNWKNF